MAEVLRSAPIFPVSDLAQGLEHYRRLGFKTREYTGGGYGFVTRDDLEIHLTVVRDLDPGASASAAYLFVGDADALAREWADAGARVTPPADTDWRQHEGSHVDPVGNLIRFGSPMPPKPADSGSQ